MMFSVSDILGLNAFSRQILANAAAAAFGMAQVERELGVRSESKGLVAITNLGVLTEGTVLAIDLLKKAGYEAITFHAIGAGGLAMEQMMKDGIICAVFDYALGEIADEVFGGLRAANSERLTVAASLGLPQVVCPGGAEHIGLLLSEPNKVPTAYQQHQYVFHNPLVFAPRLKPEELRQVARAVTQRLSKAGSNTVFMIPRRGVSRYSVSGGPLEDREGDAVFFETLKATMPSNVTVHELDCAAEDPAFVSAAISNLIQLIERPPGPRATA